MPNATINIPKNLTLQEIFSFCKELDYYSQHDRLIINIQDSTFFAPFAMIILSSKIKYLRKHCANLKVIFNGWDNHPYLSHMGFFSMCGFDHGNEIGEAKGSENYLPITEIKRDSLYVEKMDRYEELPDLIQREVDKIAEILCRDKTTNKDLFDVLSFSIREIFRNVFEHSGADSLFFCAQYWSKSNKVEFSVSDHGMGIRKSLGENPNFRYKTDKEALEYSLLPSVSGKTHLPRRSDIWFNSGYGLYMTSRLARNGGNFVIASGEHGINLTPKTKSNYLTSFPGTAIRVNLDVGEIGSVEKRLSEFRDDGRKIAAEIKGSGNRPPSAMSLLLRRDYRR